MTPDYYLSQLKIYSRFVRNFNPTLQHKEQMLKIAVGPGGGEARWTEWTESVMKAWKNRQWSWDMNGLSLHHYTVVRWPPAFKSVEFGETEYSQILKSTLEMDNLISKHSAIMDKSDPEKKSPWLLMNGGRGTPPCRGAIQGSWSDRTACAMLSSLRLT